MTDKIVVLATRQKPVHYTIDVTHHYGGEIEIFLRDIADDDRSRASAIETLIRAAVKHMTADHIHFAMLDRIDALMAAECDPETTELRRLAIACEAYESSKEPTSETQTEPRPT